MKIFAMVTTKASWEYTSYALKSFFRNTKLSPEDRLYLIDNDNGFEEEASWFSPTLEIIKNDKPKGFAANMNVAMEIAESKEADFYILHNDIIFTSGWILPLADENESIVSAISNSHTDFENSGIEWKDTLKLNQYLGRESKLKEIVARHQSNAEGYKKVISLPFFCLKIPFNVYCKVGRFNEEFLVAGFEDHDYCLRAYQAGFSVKYAKKSLLLHFNGKSTWAGAERAESTEARKKHNQEIFVRIWGQKLASLCANNDLSVFEGNQDLKSFFENENYPEVISKLCPN